MSSIGSGNPIVSSNNHMTFPSFPTQIDLIGRSERPAVQMYNQVNDEYFYQPNPAYEISGFYSDEDEEDEEEDQDDEGKDESKIGGSSLVPTSTSENEQAIDQACQADQKKPSGRLFNIPVSMGSTTRQLINKAVATRKRSLTNVFGCNEDQSKSSSSFEGDSDESPSSPSSTSSLSSPPSSISFEEESSESLSSQGFADSPSSDFALRLPRLSALSSNSKSMCQILKFEESMEERDRRETEGIESTRLTASIVRVKSNQKKLPKSDHHRIIAARIRTGKDLSSQGERNHQGEKYGYSNQVFVGSKIVLPLRANSPETHLYLARERLSYKALARIIPGYQSPAPRPYSIFKEIEIYADQQRRTAEGPDQKNSISEEEEAYYLKLLIKKLKRTKKGDYRRTRRYRQSLLSTVNKDNNNTHHQHHCSNDEDFDDDEDNDEDNVFLNSRNWLHEQKRMENHLKMQCRFEIISEEKEIVDEDKQR